MTFSCIVWFMLARSALKYSRRGPGGSFSGSRTRGKAADWPLNISNPSRTEGTWSIDLIVDFKREMALLLELRFFILNFQNFGHVVKVSLLKFWSSWRRIEVARTSGFLSCPTSSTSNQSWILGDLARSVTWVQSGSQMFPLEVRRLVCAMRRIVSVRKFCHLSSW